MNNMTQTITDRLAEALRDAIDNGLIYWEPQTSKGAENKALMFMRINKTLAAYNANRQEPSELVKRLRTRYGCSSPNGSIALTNEAADRIEELEARQAPAPVTNAEVEAASEALLQPIDPNNSSSGWKIDIRAALESAAKVRTAPSITHDNVSGLSWDTSGRIIHEPRDEP